MPTHPLTLRLRLVFDARRAIGPGKIDLLEAIAQTGSITAAARTMRMSYKRAWQLIDELNRCFVEPLITTSKGGEHGGGAQLTPTGANVTALYRRIQRKTDKAAATEVAALARLARAHPRKG